MCKGGCRKSILERIYGLFAVPIYGPFPLQEFLVNNGAGTIPLAWPSRSSCLLWTPQTRGEAVFARLMLLFCDPEVPIN